MAVIDQLRDRIADHALVIVQRAADLTVERTKDAASRDTGELVEGISHSDPVLTGSWVMCEITSAAPYSKYQDEGTGIFGPTGQRIVSQKGGPLAFVWPGNIAAQVSATNPQGLSFFMSVAGSPGRHFFHDAMPDRWRTALAESISA